MSGSRSPDGGTGWTRDPFRSVAVVWALLGVVTIAIFVTYARLPSGELYNVSGSGLAGGASRALVFLNYSTALVAIPILALIAERLAKRWWVTLAVIGIALSAVVAWPGVVDQADLDAKPVNAPAALGVLAAVALTPIVALRHGWPELPVRPRFDPVRLVVAAAVLMLGIPWIAADLGLSFDGVPVLGTLFQSGELRSQPGIPGLQPAVHHGHHHGMDGVLLVLAALLLSRVIPSVASRWVGVVVGAYLALMLSYGIGNIANDFWLEQVVKRGWTSWEIPDVTRPEASLAWGFIVLGAIAILAVSAWADRTRPALRRTSLGERSGTKAG